MIIYVQVCIYHFVWYETCLSIKLFLQCVSSQPSIVSLFISFWAFNPVLYLEDWGHHEQSSLQPPVFVERSVHCCTSLNLWTLIWTWAWRTNMSDKWEEQSVTQNYLNPINWHVMLIIKWLHWSTHELFQNKYYIKWETVLHLHFSL
jgi:hypothetical protein